MKAKQHTLIVLLVFVLSAGAALEKSAFPTYRFFLIWLMALFSRRETWA